MELAKQQGIKSYSRMRKAELVEAIVKADAPDVLPERKREPEESRERRASARERQDQEQERVERAKYYMGPSTYRIPEKPVELPRGYGEDRIVLMVRDPYWVHAYWEITPARIQQAKEELGDEWPRVRWLLRVYDVSEEGVPGQGYFDVELSGGATNWYINVGQPGRRYCVDIGVLTPGGRFYALARSNQVTTPPDRMSSKLDERWPCEDEAAREVWALSCGFGGSSLELQQLLEERFRQELASGVVSSLASGAFRQEAPARKFWFVVDTELIVYGATEPDAKVTLQGQPVKLRPDGTFSVRLALPDGEQVIPVTATSKDEEISLTITPCVSRKTV